jgi:hypothetical protein
VCLCWGEGREGEGVYAACVYALSPPSFLNIHMCVCVFNELTHLAVGLDDALECHFRRDPQHLL